MKISPSRKLLRGTDVVPKSDDMAPFFQVLILTVKSAVILSANQRKAGRPGFRVSTGRDLARDSRCGMPLCFSRKRTDQGFQDQIEIQPLVP